MRKIMSEDRELRRNETVRRFASRLVSDIQLIHVDKFALIRIRMKRPRPSQQFIHKRSLTRAWIGWGVGGG